MKKLTDKQQAFVALKIAGVTNRDAAISAGYSVASAAVAADKLMNNPAVRAAIKGSQAAIGNKPAAVTMPRETYAEPMAFLMDVMNHQGLPMAVRAEAAKQLLPYHHARKGESGKKEKADQRARDVVDQPRARFAPTRPPRFHTIPGGKED